MLTSSIHRRAPKPIALSPRQKDPKRLRLPIPTFLPKVAKTGEKKKAAKQATAKTNPYYKYEEQGSGKGLPRETRFHRVFT